MNVPEKFSILFDLMQNSDRQGALAYVKGLLKEGVTPELIIQDLIDPILVKQGIMWGQGQIALAQAYISAKIAEDALMVCMPSPNSSALVKKRGTIVIGNIEDDFHGLGRKIVVIFLKANGWEIHDLGNDVLAGDFVDAALQHNASIIAVSAMMYTTALNVRKVHEELLARGQRGNIKLAVGGAVFNGRPQLAEEVGADGTAINAFETIQLMDKLLHQNDRGKTR